MSHQEILIADAHVEQLHVLLSGLRPGVHVQLVSSQDDAMQLLAQALAQPELDTLHVLGHGAPGEVILGGQKIDTSAMPELQRLLHNSTRHPDTQICLWSCRAGADQTGDIFMNAFAQTTNATVFASENLVGHTHKGGTWTLEKSAAPRMGVPFNVEALETFEGVLATPTITTTTSTVANGTTYFDSGISSTDRISNDVNFVLSGGSGSNGNSKNLYERISTDGGVTFGAWTLKSAEQNDFTVVNASNGVHQYVWQNVLPSGTATGALTLVVDTVAMTATAVDGIIGVTNATDMFMVTLSEAPSRDLTSADFVSTNSSISTFLKIDSTHYSVSLTPTANTASGNMTLGIKAGITDIAGNPTVAATIATHAIDTVAPGTPSNLDLAAADDTGSSNTDNITNQTTGLTITGNAEANATVELFNGSVSLGKVTANSSGVFTTDISLSGSSTAYNITAKATDAAGNASGASLPLTITVDTVAPNAASISTVGGADVFANAVQVTLSGASSDVNATVVKVSDGVTGHAAVTATYNSTTGTWSADITGLNRGALTVTADVADAAGNHALAAKTVYSSIGSAVAAATAGSTVTIAQGTYQDSSFAASSVTGTTTVREIMISKGISIVGLGDGNSANGQEVIINSSAASRAFVVSGDVTSDAVSISGIKVVGGKEAVSVDGADHVTALGSLTVTNSTFVGQSTTGLMVELEKQGSDLGRLVVQGVVFDQSGSAGKSININNNGANYYEGIRTFGFDGSAVIKDVTVMGASGGVTTNAAQYGIHLHGASSNNMGASGIYGSGPTMGDVTLDNVVVTGGFAKNAVAIYDYANIDGLHGAQGALNISGAKAGWGTVLNVDGIEANYDASKWGVVLGNNMASLQGEDYSGATLLQPGNVGSQIVGTAGTDIFNGKAGNDVLNGGSGLDIAQVGATTASDVSFGRAAGTNALTVSTSFTGTDTLSNVEYVTATNPLTGATIKTFVIVDAFADTATAIAAAPAGSQLVKAGLLDLNLTDVAAAQAKGLTFYGADNVTVHASAADLLAKGPALVTLQGMGVDSFITTDVVSKVQYDTLVSNAGSANSIVTPSVTITDNQPAVANVAGGDVTYKFTFDQAVTNFSASDVDVTHGTKGALVESTVPGEQGRVFTLTVTPQAGFEGSMSLTVGNASSSQVVDTSAPAAPVVTDDSALTNGYATSTTQTISVDAEAGSAVVVTNAAGAVLASGTADAAGHFSANVTGLSLGDNSLTATATDKAGNTSDVSASLNIHVNNDPVVTGTLSQAAAEGADTFTTSLLANATDADGNTLTVTNVSFTVDGVAVTGTPAGVSISGNSISVNPQDASFDPLPQGAQRSITVNYSVDDGHGGVVASSETISITGTNDAPVIELGGHTFIENTVITGSLAENVTDVDTGDTHTFSLVGEPIAGFTLHSDGSFVINTNSYDRLAEGEKLDIPVTVGVDDGNGGYVTKTVVVTIEGTNDVAAVSSSTTALSEGNDAAAISTSGQLVITDADGGQAAVAPQEVAGTYGTFHVNADGSWTYNGNGAHNELSAGQKVSDSITVTSVDGTATGTIAVNITGTNDAPVINTESGHVFVENNTYTGNLNNGWDVTDLDIGDTHTFALVGEPVNGFTLHPDGSWVIDTNAYDRLAEGEKLDIPLTISVDDGQGGVVTKDIVVTIEGTNDPATVVSTTTAVTEGNDASALNTSGQLVIADADAGQALVVAQDVKATYGTFHVNADGSWTYTGNGAHNELTDGQKVSDSIIVTSVDGTATGNITVNITGTNDAAVVSTGSVVLTESNTALTTNGVLTISDVDSSATFQPATMAGTYGNLDIAENGAWTYTANSAHNEFASGQTYSETFTVKASDGSPSTVSVNIAGTNDAAVLSSATVALTETNAVLSTSGVLTISDVDSSAAFQPATVAGTYGSLTIDANGAWTYTAANAHNEFVDGQNYSESFTVNASDGTPTSVAVNIAGTNDVALLSSATVNLTESNYVLTSSGTLTAIDVDSAATFQAGTQTGTYGSLTVNANGTWNYTSRTAHNEFVGNQTYSETFSVKSADGTATSVVVNIKGTNDNPVVSAVTSTTATVTEDGGLHAQGQLSATDAENQALTWTTQKYEGKYGSVSVDATGKWSYDLNNTKAQAIGANTVQEQFEVKATDTQGGFDYRQITINILGQNDPPIISSAVNSTQGLVAEDGTVATSGQLMATDAEGQALTWSTADYNGSLGSMSVSNTGKWTYNLDNAKAQQLAGGASVTETFNVKVTDSQGGVAIQQITVTIAGANDTASVTSSVQTVSEADAASALNTSGKVVVTDVDNGQTLVLAQDVKATYGTFHMNADGSWTYTGNGAHNELTAGQKVSDSITVTSVDGTGSGTITVNITGTNDLATVSSNATAVTEGNDASALNTSGQLVIADADAGQALVVAQDVKATYGTFHVNADGSWTYTGNGAHNELTEGQKVSDSITVTSVDGTGSGTITVNITGTNDVASVSSSTVEVKEGNSTVVTSATAAAVNQPIHLVNGLEADGSQLPIEVLGNLPMGNSDRTFLTRFEVDPLATSGGWATQGATILDYGTLSSYSKVKLHLYRDNVNEHPYASLNSYRKGDLVVDFQVGWVGTNGANLDDGKFHDVAVTFNAQQGVKIIIDGLAVPTYSGANGFALGAVNTTGSYLSMGIARESNVLTGQVQDIGIYNQALSADQIQSFMQTDTLVKDGLVATVAHPAAPVNVSQVTGNDASALNASGQLVIADADAGQALVVAQDVKATYGTFHVNADGSWTYTGNGAHNELTEGQKVSDSITVTSVDGTGSGTITVNITGTNDLATVSSAVTAVTEGNDASALNTSGQLVIADADAGQALVVAQDVKATYGTFHVNADGSWTYTGNGAHNELTEGQKVSDSITVTSVDGTATGTISVNITGTNDAAVISGSSSGALTETNAVLTMTGQLLATDVDNAVSNLGNFAAAVKGDTHQYEFLIAKASDGTTGWYQGMSDGTGGWTYVLQSNQLANKTITSVYTLEHTQAVLAATTTADQRLVAVRSEFSNSATLGDFSQVKDVTAIVGVDNMVNFLDLKEVNLSNIPDYAPNLPYANEGPFVTYGGKVALPTERQYFISAHDGSVPGGWAAFDQIGNHQIDLGSWFFDRQVLASVDLTDKFQTSPGLLNGKPLTVFNAQSNLTGSNGYGSFTIDATGKWTYTMNSAHNEFVGGKTYTDSVTVKTIDGTTQVITVTLNGTDDKSVISGTSSVALSETNVVLTAAGQLSVSDVDSATPTFVPQTNVTGSAGYGSFSVDVNGKWTYLLNGSHNEFAAGSTYNDSITVKTSDGNSQIVTVSIAGTNDAAVIGGSSTATLTETNLVQAASGQLSVTDVDSAASFVVQNGIAGSNGFGSFSVDASGKWSYTMNSAHDEFKGGTAYTDSFTVATADGTTKVVTVTINGTNDAAVITGTTASALTESNLAQSTSGKLTATDVDSDTSFVVQTDVAGSNGYGKFTLGADGTWTYTMGTAHDELVGGQTYTDSFTAKTADGTSQVVTVSITGTNDAAVIGGVSVANILESNAVQSVSAALTVSDVDSSATFITQSGVNGVNGYGKFSLDASGKWTYTMNTAHDEFVAGQTYTDSFTAVTADGTSKVVTVTMTGTDDKSVIAGTNAAALTETNAIQSAGGSLTVTDVDGPTPGFIAQNAVAGNNGYGVFSINASGNWTYTMNTAHDEFVAGKTYTDSITVSTIDGVNQVVTVSIKGTNDAASIGGSVAATLTETNAIQTANGVLTVTDVDSSATFVAQTVNGNNGYGKFTIDAAGKWSYVMASAHDEFAAGKTYTDSFNATTADGTVKSVTVSIIGTNDLSTIGGVKTANLNESNVAQTVSGQLSVVDVDSTTTVVAMTNAAGTNGYGSFSVDTSGKWTYVMNAAHDEFRAGTTYNDSITIKTTDGVSQVVTVSIAGTNDAAVISGVSTANLTETNAIQTVSGVLSSVDQDSAAGFTAQLGVKGSGGYGTFSMDASGKWTYVMGSAHDEFKAGITYTDSFTATSADGTAKVVTVSMLGTDDQAVISGTSAQNLTETNAALTTSGTLTATDADGTAVFVAQTAVVGSNGYGSFNVDTAGKWVYTMNGAHNEFAAGKTYTDSFTVKTADGASKLVSVTIAGTDDATVIQGVSTASLTETNSIQAATGKLVSIDVDSTTAFVAQASVAGSSGYGTFKLGTDGTWTYNMNTAHDEFKAGTVYTDSFTAKAADGTAQVVTVTINGSNDAAVITGTSTGALVQSVTALTTSGSLSATDIDNIAVNGGLFNVQTAVKGSGGYGNFSVDATGKWTYTMNDAHKEFKAGVVYTDSFSATTTDGTSKLVSVNITGTDDKAVIAGVSTQAVTETNVVLTTEGTLTYIDPDGSVYSPFVAQINVVGANGYGRFSLGTDGHWLYSASSAHDEFIAGKTYTDSFTAVTADGSSQVVTVTITGTNDAAVIGGVTAVTLTETNVAQTVTGQMTIADVDSNPVFVAQTLVPGSGGYGKFTVDTTGKWTYVMNTAHDEFAAGTTYVDKLTVLTADGTSQVVTVNIVGTNDAAVIGGVSTNALPLLETNAVLTTSGALTITDVDNPAAFVPQTAASGNSGYGKFTVDATGKWTYTTNTAHDEFVKDVVYTDSITVNAVDGTAKVITVTMVGTNDAAVIGGVSAANLTETNAAQTATGQLTITDVDNPATFVAQTGSAGLYGKFTVDTTGAWTYVMGTAHDEFIVSKTYTESFNVVSADGTVKAVNIIITGTNDAAVIGGVSTVSLTETNAAQTTGGQLTITDVDSAATFVAQPTAVGSNGYGKFTLDATGKWTYIMNTAHDEFKDGVTYTDSFTAVSADGTAKVVTVTMTGTNDAAVVGGVSTTALTESNAIQTVAGQLTVTDVDNAATFNVQTAVAGSNGFGSFSVDATGKWTYTMNTAHDEFKAGEIKTDSFNAVTADGTVKTVTVTITGTNDAAVITGVNTATLTETDAAQTVSGSLLISDVDSAATFVTQSGATGSNSFGKFSLTADGTWTYTMTTAHDEFKAGEIKTDSFIAVSADGTTKVVTVTINGTNDAAVIGGSNVATITETNAVQSAAGQLTISDVDSAATFVAQTAVSGNNGYGKFTVDATGKWTYLMNSAHDEFVKDVNYTDSVTVTSADGTTKVITVTMTGTNDAAVIGGVNTATLTETNAVQTTGGQLTISDVDNNPPVFLAQTNVTGTNGYGSFTVDATGKWSYTMNSAHDEFAGGKTYTDSITVISEDGTPKVITVTLNGTDDLAVISGSNTAALTETNAIQTAGGILSATDVDNNPVAPFVAQTGVKGDHGYGTFTVDTNGKWSYVMDSAHDEFVGGITYTDSFTVKTSDGASKLVTVSMLGTDDTSTISGTSAVALTETDATLNTSGKLLSSDIDSPVAAPFVEQSGTAGDHGYGSFSLDASGNWTYTANSAHNEFAVGQTYTDSFTAVTADGTSQVVTVTITGTNDAAVIGGTVALSLTETDVIQSTDTTQLTISDVDSSQTFNAVTVAGASGYGSFSLDASGNWTYTMGSAHNEFVDGVVYTDSAVVTAADGTTQTLQVNITGTNDLSVITGTSDISITENNDAQVVSGNLVATDPDNVTSFVPQTDVVGSAGLGTFTVDASGKWVYTMTTAHNELLPTEVFTDSITVTTIDGVQQLVSVTIQGADAASTFQGDVLMQMSEADSNVSVSGQLSTVDADSAVAALVTPQTSTGDNGYGSFAVDSTGAWTYTLNGAHNEFVAGQTYIDTTTVSNVDGTKQVVTVEITGTNDAAVISGATTGSIIESNAVQSVSGQLVSTDVDNAATFTAQSGVAGSSGYGSFSIQANGVWTYTMNTAHDEFVAGTVYTDTATVTSIDGTTQVISVNITGSNEAAVITPVVSQLLETNDILSATGQIEVADTDNAALMQAETLVGTYGSLTVAADGSWTYVTDSAHNEFVANQTYVDNFTVHSIDGTSGSFQVNILGTNDVAVISGTTKLSLTESNVAQTATATAISTDADNAGTFVARSGLDGDHGYGTFSIDASGQWTYNMNTAHDEFVAGQTYSDSVTVSTLDGTSLTLKVEIAGTNDAAIVTSNQVVLFETDAALTSKGQLEISDVDSSASFNATTMTGDYGTLSLNSTGAWTYLASSAHNEFITNGLYTDTFNVTSLDGTSTTIKVNFIGTAESNNDLYSGTAAVNVPTSFTDNSLVHLSTAGVQQVNGGFDNIGLLVNAREDVVKLDFNLANADFKTSADGHHVEVTYNHDASTLKLLSNVEAVQFNDALVRIIGADGYASVAEATNAANKSHVNATDAVFVTVATGYDALLAHPSVADLNDTFNRLTDAHNLHG